MVNKNDLSTLKMHYKNTLLNIEKSVWRTSTHVAGRKPKEWQEKQSEMVGLRFTPSELATIKQQAGLVPVATFLKNALITKTNILSN